MALPEDGPLSDIEAFFVNLHLQLVSHEEPPPKPTPEEWRRMSSLVREATKHSNHRHWVDLKRVETGALVRWFGGGESAEAATRLDGDAPTPVERRVVPSRHGTQSRPLASGGVRRG